MKKTLLSLAILASGSAASAATMSCLIGVATGKDMITEEENDKAMQILKINLDKEGAAEGEIKLNGETVAYLVSKRQYVDIYDISYALTTPAADRIPGASFVAIIDEKLANDGPAKDNGWTVDYQPGATLFTYLDQKGGSYVITPKFKAALVKAGKWGQYPFTSTRGATINTYNLAEVAKELITAKHLKESDVLLMTTALDCTLNK